MKNVHGPLFHTTIASNSGPHVKTFTISELNMITNEISEWRSKIKQVKLNFILFLLYSCGHFELSLHETEKHGHVSKCLLLCSTEKETKHFLVNCSFK